MTEAASSARSQYLCFMLVDLDLANIDTFVLDSEQRYSV